MSNLYTTSYSSIQLRIREQVYQNIENDVFAFDSIELQKGALLQKYTYGGEDKTTIDADINSFFNVCTRAS